METKISIKPKRHKKRQSRTEVSSDSESEPEKATKVLKIQDSNLESKDATESIPKLSPPLDAESKSTAAASRKSSSKTVISSQPAQPVDPTAHVNEAFTSYYMQRAAAEFADDLNAIRGADDFKGEALNILVHALQQGTEMFGFEEKKRVIGARVEK